MPQQFAKRYTENFSLPKEGMELQEQMKIHLPELLIVSTQYIPQEKQFVWNNLT